MPVWLIEIFGSRDLNNTFIFILLMTAPIWLLMILFDEASWVRKLAQPHILPPLYCLLLAVLLFKSHQSVILPDPLAPISYESAKDFSRHPISFLALFCNLQILNLTVGMYMYQKACSVQVRIRVELLLCWFVGAIALVPFTIRMLLKGKRI